MVSGTRKVVVKEVKRFFLNRQELENQGAHEGGRSENPWQLGKKSCPCTLIN